MKKTLVLLVVLILVFSLFPSAAFADLIIPPEETPEPAPVQDTVPLLPILLIAVAVLAIAFVLWRFLRKRA